MIMHALDVDSILAELEDAMDDVELPKKATFGKDDIKVHHKTSTSSSSTTKYHYSSSSSSSFSSSPSPSPLLHLLFTY